MKRQHDFLIENEGALVLPACLPYRQLQSTCTDPHRLEQNRLTAAPLDLIALLARYLDTGALQQLARFLFDAYAIQAEKCFTRYAPPQHSIMRVLLDELRQRNLFDACVRARETRITRANEPRNFPARIQPEAAARRTQRVVRDNQFVLLFFFVNCELE